MKNKTYIIAEIAQGFEGNPWICKKYIELAKKCGADAVKFQIFLADELATKDYQYYDLFKSLEIHRDTWIELIAFTNGIGIDFLSDVYGTETLSWISKTGIKGIKVHSTDIMNYPLLRAISETKIMVYLSVGGSTKEEIQNALKITGNSSIALLSGFQAEPNHLIDLELDKLDQLRKMFGIPVGYADHIDADSDLATVVPVVAVVKGASIIEKHLTIDRTNLQLEDCVSALNPDEFKKMVLLIRDIDNLPKGSEYGLSDREMEYRNKTKRSVVLCDNIEKGDKLESKNLKLIRTGVKGDFFDMNEVIGKKINKSLSAGDIVRKDDLI